MKGSSPGITAADSGKAALAPDKSTLAPGLRLLPSDARADVYRLYGVLRTLDDLVDEDRPPAAQRVEAVEHWAREEPADTPETVVLTEISSRHELPRQALLEFCRGMRHDIAREVIQTEDDLESYCQQAGGSVGIMLACILGTSGPEGEEKMAALGRAMQRTNILRDIDDDAFHERRYISQSTIERFGEPVPDARAELFRDQIARADALYEQAADGIKLLTRGQRGMALCATLYREILRQIEREGFGRTPGRTTVPVWRRHLLITEYRLGLRI